ncbi:hypothetical protein [Thermoflavimicrobium dichotomicum]|uniref:Uncharacterized protein n=1 Tax=Thermoflavimicrobium dichotomicum TaxID=46223 RepID=A0A1I3JFB3_9BACL|nr:hypothetical protein [Thermoflavimicrobium dichotomicum]SFI58957.1 hypothetical protein SAMN05421852_10154 [Thermoflavimicrobium dichotomicum]
MAKKRKKEPRVASVDAHGILVRELKGTFLWFAIASIVASALAVIRYMLF